MNPGHYRPESASGLAKSIGASEMIVELGTVPYQHLHQIYARADVYVTPAYTETFAHPLVEAMSCGVPVVASDLAVHREICGDAAVYFPTFSPEGLADGLGQVISSPETSRRLATSGVERSRSFSWKAHVEEILALCSQLV
jgi:glycosyltransferase involved in cell wall biosynthesis